MTDTAYVDSSCLVAMALEESGSGAVADALYGYKTLVGSNLVEAELRAAVRREHIDRDPGYLLADIQWIHPDRPLTAEIIEVLAAGYVRGPDLWHLANALFLSPDRTIDFVTLDVRQGEISRRLGFGPRSS